MKHWEWSIPELHLEYLDRLGVYGYPLLRKLAEIQNSEDGMPNEGTTQIWPDVYLYEYGGQRIIYERIVANKILYLVDIEPVIY